MARETENEIRTALNAGLTVIAHNDNVSMPGWTGAGYIIFNPETGSGAYKISGGANGGWLALAISVFLALIALFPAIAALFTTPFISLLIVVVVVLTFSNVLNSLDGCAGDIGLGVAILSALFAAIPARSVAILRVFVESLLLTEGFPSAENSVCKLN